MAENLFPCPDCEGLVSRQAFHCPFCGHRFARTAQLPSEGLFLRTLNVGCLLSFAAAAALVLLAIGLWTLAALASTRV